MRHAHLLLWVVFVFAVACGGDGAGKVDASGPDGRIYDAAIDAPWHPPMPALGTQIDRAGRPGVSTALVAAFEGDQTLREMIKGSYNADGDTANWGANWAPTLAAALAIFDGLDAENDTGGDFEACGNQLAADLGSPRYSFLAAVLADDQLYLDSTKGSCDVYLAVEANALGVPLAGCGGRTPTMDVIDVTYSVLVNGTLSDISDGVAADIDGSYDLDAFPFLLSPSG